MSGSNGAVVYVYNANTRPNTASECSRQMKEENVDCQKRLSWGCLHQPPRLARCKLKEENITGKSNNNNNNPPLPVRKTPSPAALVGLTASASSADATPAFFSSPSSAKQVRHPADSGRGGGSWFNYSNRVFLFRVFSFFASECHVL